MKIYGLSRSRDKHGNIVKRNLNPFVNCLHASCGGGYETMQILVVEVYETEDTASNQEGIHRD